MTRELKKKDIFEYFRIGLAAGLVDIPSVIAWADDELMQNPAFDQDVIELSLSGSLPYSQLIWLLSSFQGKEISRLAPSLVFARAGCLLEQEPEQVEKITQAVGLLLAEHYLSKDDRVRLSELMGQFWQYKQEMIGLEALRECLNAFLSAYGQFREVLISYRLQQPTQP